jgi:DNA topoisomerase VI subunit B
LKTAPAGAAAQELPPTVAFTPHPRGVEPDRPIQMLNSTRSRYLLQFLRNETSFGAQHKQGAILAKHKSVYCS